MLLDISLNKHGIRNATTTCIAPTGTISIICGTTGGIEPLYSVAYTRNIMEGTELVEVNSEFERISKERGFYSEELMKKIAKEGSIQNIDEIPDDIKKIFVTAHDIDPEYHVKMQASFQEFTDNAVSKTVNFNNNATKEEIFKTYMLAYELGLKGITVYRDGSRMFQPMSVKKEVTDQDSTHDNVVTVHNKPRVRPHTTHGKTEKINTGCGSLFITVNRDDVGLSEVFISMGKSGGCPTSQSEAIGRLISLSLRSNVSIKEVVDQLKGIRCPNPTLGKGCMVLSCSDAISKVLEKYIDDENNDKKVKLSISDVGVCPECPECSTMLQIKEGCISCPSCGYSKCG
jgi:ribonucleoside-diphosphate reductase alpha chain